MEKKSVAIITARGGSKRIPRKNIKDFCGKPVLAYSIEAALSSGIFQEVMVSTDDEEIKQIALQYGAKVPFMRSAEMSNDTAATHEVIHEVLTEYQKREKNFEVACCIYPAAPFVTAEKLKNAYQILTEQRAHTVYPVVPFSFPPQRGVVIRNGIARFMYPENEFVRSQDLETIYHDCGQFYFLNVNEFFAQNKLILEKAIPIIVSELEAQDIDNEDDWKLAEIKYRYFREEH